MPPTPRLITARFTTLDLATTADSIAALGRAVSEAAGDRYEVVGWLRRDDSGGMLFLGRELSSSALVGLRLAPEGMSDEGEDQFSLSITRQFDASTLPLGGECDNCGGPLTGWETFCGQCGFAVETADGQAAGGSPEELQRAVEEAVGDRFTLIGEVPQARGAFFARERDSGKLAAVRLTSGKAKSTTRTPSLGPVTMFDHGTLSPHSGPLGALGESGPNYAATGASRAAAEPDARKKVCPKCGTEYGAEARFCPKDREELKFVGQTEAMIGEVIARKYRIMRKLGGGGMGRVYLAEHIEMGRLDAVKLMLPHWVSDPDALKRFRREALNASQVKHANVATVYDFGDAEDGAYFLAMEYVQGPTLGKLITDRGRLDVADAVRIGAQIARALEAAHSLPQPVVHRDLKPDNVLLATRTDEDPATDGEVKVVDFGIARAMGDEAQRVSVTKMMIGTPAYMSTEQFAATRVDGRADIYALGCILYEMLVGEHAYPERDLHAIINRKLMGELPRVRVKRPDVPQWLDDVVAKAMAKTADDRFATARELRSALESHAGPVPKPKPQQSRTRLAGYAGGLAVLAAGIWLIARFAGAGSGSDPTIDSLRNRQRPESTFKPLPLAASPDTLRSISARIVTAEAAAERGEYRTGARLLSALAFEIGVLEAKYGASRDTLVALASAVQLRASSLKMACEAEGAQARQRSQTPPPCK